MKTTIFLVRTASYDRDTYSITSSGIQEVKTLAQSIKEYIADDNKDVVIWTSSFKAAESTAEIIKEELQSKEFKVFNKLATVGVLAQDADFPWLEKMIQDFDDEKNDNMLIIVSHWEYVFDFPTVYGFLPHTVGNAGALILDRESLSIVTINPNA